MNDDELAARLRAADPARDDVPASSWLDDLVEDTMSAPSTAPETTPARSRRWIPLAAAAAVLVVGAGAVGFALSGGDEPPPPAAAPPTVTELTLPGDDALQSCVRVEAAFLRNMDLALDGTAVALEDGSVTLDVTRWYKGGDTDQVELIAPATGQLALIGAVEFEVGERYLITAGRGMVNSCGFSGPWSQELEDLFVEAFSGSPSG